MISSLGVYAKVNGMGFIETPYRKVTNGVVDLITTPVYLSAEEEEGQLIAQANIQMDASGKITAENVIAKQDADFPVVPPTELDYADVAPNQIASISASLIPSLELTNFRSLWIKQIHWLRLHTNAVFRLLGPVDFRETEQVLRYVTFTIPTMAVYVR